MARTYKKYTGMCYRSPRGRVQARRAGVRKGAVPPDAWDDIAFDKQVYLPYTVAKGLAKEGYSYGYIVRHVQKKFKMRLSDAEWAAEYGGWSRPDTPEGCLRVYDEVDEMALKKARKIVVGDDTYRWKVSSRGGLHLAMEREGERGRKVVWLEDDAVVTPGVVRTMIEKEWGGDE